MDKLLEKHKLSIFTQRKVLYNIVKIFPQRQIPAQIASVVLSITYLKNNYVQIFPEILKEGNTSQHTSMSPALP